jgi:hypothetical protein
MGKNQSAGQKRLQKMRLLCKLTTSERVDIEKLVEAHPDVSDSDRHLIYENYARVKLNTSLPLIGAVIRDPARIGRITGGLPLVL